MLNRILCYLKGWLGVRHRLRIPTSYLRQCSVQSKASNWHSYAIKQRPWRPHVCVPCSWINQTVPHSAHIFEVGCGSGANLLWLQQQGFSNLHGNDISPAAVDMSKLLSDYFSTTLNIQIDDAMQPTSLPSGVNALLSVNWLYHLQGTSLDAFLEIYKNCLAPKGYMAFDIISSAYNSIKDNQYHTADLSLPVAQRRASEYTFRMSMDQVTQCVKKHGFVLNQQKNLHCWPPRMAFMIQNRGAA